MKARYYSPRLDRDLISLLFREGKMRKVPMTKLASDLIRQGLKYERVIDRRSVRLGEE